MPIDFKNEKGRKEFINNNLSDLLLGVNDTYGPILVEELIKRIENTINQFNEQINTAFKQLKDKDLKRQEYIKNINDDLNDFQMINNDSRKTEWETKIDEIESENK